MQVQINERVLKREARLSKVLLGITFLLLGLGMFLSIQSERWGPSLEAWVGPELVPWVPVAITYAIVLVGVFLMQVANPRIRRYAPQHRQELRLKQLLKGLDDRYTLYAFLGGGLPDYVLVGPSGVFVLVTRPQQGEITCRGDRWSRQVNPFIRPFVRLYGNPIGSPSYDAAQGVRRIREMLEKELSGDAEEAPLQGLIAFTGDRVKLRVERCAFPATTGRELRKVISKSKVRLNQVQLGQLRAAFDAARIR